MFYLLLFTNLFYFIFSRHESSEATASMATKPVQPNDAIRFNDIIKSQNDKRLYRGLILSNKMRVLLISDSTTDKSAASLDVNIGNLLTTIAFMLTCINLIDIQTQINVYP